MLARGNGFYSSSSPYVWRALDNWNGWQSSGVSINKRTSFYFDFGHELSHYILKHETNDNDDANKNWFNLFGHWLKNHGQELNKGNIDKLNDNDFETI